MNPARSPIEAMLWAAENGEALRLDLKGPAGRLETFFEPSERRGPGPTAVVCHPNPKAGGTMGHKVVHTAAKALRAAGFHSIRFNYRGVGKSDGAHGDHGEERDDVRAVLAAAGELAGARDPLMLAGFSFGTWVGLPEGELESRVIALVAIGMPLGVRDFPYPRGEGLKPLLIVQGREDEFAAPAGIDQWAAQRPGPTEIVWIDSGHFFHGKLRELEAAIEAFASARRTGLPMPDPGTG